MFQLRKSADRGHGDHGWLDSYHTFSFADYYDPDQMGFRSLRVINEDRVQPGMGFGTHGHRDMEIVTLVLSGALEHRDSLGNGEVLRPGELQRMTAGTGIRHSEFNPSSTEPVHLYQIWILPDRPGRTPSYEQRAVVGAHGRWQLVASPDGRNGSLTVNQDVQISLATMENSQELAYPLASDRHAWLQVLRGNVQAGGHELAPGDGLAVSGESDLAVRATEAAEALLFDLA